MSFPAKVGNPDRDLLINCLDSPNKSGNDTQDMFEQCLGIDWGEARIGLALGNSEVKLASPFGVVKNLEELKEVINKEKIEHLILGEPVNDKMNENFLAFKKELENIGLPLTLVDERFSSQAADSLDPNARKEGNRDAMAAMVILQGWFDGVK